MRVYFFQLCPVIVAAEAFGIFMFQFTDLLFQVDDRYIRAPGRGERHMQGGLMNKGQK